MRHALDGQPRQELAHRFDVNVGRPQQYIGERSAVVEAVLQRRAGLLQQSSNQGKSVGMRAAGSQGYDRIAVIYGLAGDDAALLHYAHAEAGQVVFARDERAGVFRRLPADEGATGDFAATRYTGNHLFGDVHIQAFADIIIQKEQGLGALYQQVVGAHGHQIYAYTVMPAGRGRQFQFRAYAVGPGHQYRFTVSQRGEIKKAAETAYATHDTGPVRALDPGLDPLDQLVAAINTDTGVGITDCFLCRHGRQ